MIFSDIGIEVYQKLTHFYKGTRIALMGKDPIHCSTNSSCLLSAFIFPRHFKCYVFGVVVFFSRTHHNMFKLSHKELPGGLNVLLSPLT